MRTLTRSDEWPRARESFSFVLDLSKLHSFGEQKLTMGSPRVEKILYVDKYSALLFGSAVLGCVTKNRTFRRNGNVPFSQIRRTVGRIGTFPNVPFIVMHPWGAFHKIGRFRNVPTVGTFVNEFNFNLLINVPSVGTFRKRPILCNAPLKALK